MVFPKQGYLRFKNTLAATLTTAIKQDVFNARARGYASSLHASGRRARRVVEESRERIAQAVGARPGEVVLTSGGTEADNLAVKGLYWARRAADPRRARVLASAVEHHAVRHLVGPIQSNKTNRAAKVAGAPPGAARSETACMSFVRFA